MGPALGQADSFNSSGATIMPDNNEIGSRHHTRSRLSAGTAPNQNVSALVAQSRMLMPADTLGKELEALATASDVLGDDGLTLGHNWPSELDQSGEAESYNSQLGRELTFSQLLGPSSPPVPPFEHFPTNVDSNHGFDNGYASNLSHHTVNGNFFDFRPSSALSNTSNSEYSYTSTERDDDSEMSDSMPQPQGRNDHLGDGLALLNMSSVSPQPQAFWNHQSQPGNDIQSSNGRTVRQDANWDGLRTITPDSVSPREAPTSTGPVRGKSAVPTDRLEHRRQINRRSATKHRTIKKEELASLKQKLAERDHEVLQLQKDLAVEKAKVVQLAEIVQKSGITFGNQPAAW